MVGDRVALELPRVGLVLSCATALVNVHGGKKVGDGPLELSFNARVL